jgi:hypothetical protein
MFSKFINLETLWISEAISNRLGDSAVLQFLCTGVRWWHRPLHEQHGDKYIRLILASSNISKTTVIRVLTSDKLSGDYALSIHPVVEAQ